MKKEFNVLIWDFNTDSLRYYDVLPYFRIRYQDRVNNPSKFFEVPKTLKETKAFIESESRHRFWSKCEYEMIIQGWPVQKRDYKLDVYEQIMMNIDIISEIFFNEQINNTTN